MKRRNGLQIMGKLIGLVRPLLHVMLGAILLGVAGYLCAIFLTVLAGMGILKLSGFLDGFSLPVLFAVLGTAAVLRGVLHYGEQACNHYIAFKLLALIRHQVFASLRRLCPAKLDGKDKGNLISILTTDIELLEVFYAHTISPIAIAVLTSLVMEIFFFYYSIPAGLFALCGYLAIGVLIPVWNSGKGSGQGIVFRNQFGDLNSFVLDSLRGLDETIQYGCGQKQLKELEQRSRKLNEKQTILLFLCALLYRSGLMDLTGVFLCTILMMGSFGPVVALSSLSNNLMQTLASGERVLNLLEESPESEDITGQEHTRFDNITCKNLHFSYEDEQILSGYSISVPKGSRVGIHGKSGSGKSTLLKLLMRFYDADQGSIRIGSREIDSINTTELRDMESYVAQETSLFHDSIANNIAIAKLDASQSEIEAAARKASLHEFIQSLPDGYDTMIGELGDTLSGGEKQRIGIARAFLHNAPLLLLDEPTSNLDSLNESIILHSLEELGTDKTVLIVSHRESTMAAADIVYEMSGRVS